MTERAADRTRVRLLLKRCFLAASIGLASIALTGCGSAHDEVQGQVFIVTRGGNSLKLGGVSVVAVESKALQASLQNTLTEFEKERDEVRHSNESLAEQAHSAALEGQRRADSLEAASRRPLVSAEAEVAAVYERLLQAQKESDAADAAYSKAHMDGLMRRGTSVRPGDEPAQAELERRNQTVATVNELRSELARVSARRDELKAKVRHREVQPEVTRTPEPVLDLARYFLHLPSPVASSETDADGRFVLNLPKGVDVVLVAQASRDLVGESEQYHWLVSLPRELPKGKPVLLNNSNLTESLEPSMMIRSR